MLRNDVVSHEHGKDKFGRTLGGLEVGGKDVPAQMLDAGLAWHYVKYDHLQVLAAEEQTARAAKRGLCADAKLVPPVEWWSTEQRRKQYPINNSNPYPEELVYDMRFWRWPRAFGAAA